jgi:glycosyltransferase involved in cell wall biosynthesis
MEMKISAIFIKARNLDEALFKKCRDSVSWCDEIVQIEGYEGNNFAKWRNEGADKAKGDWLFYVDTDEEVTPELKKVILAVTGTDEFAAYAMPRRNFIFGKEMKHCGLWPDYVLRLIKKDKLEGWSGELHEQPKIKGEISHLKEPLIHHKHKAISEMVEKTNDWSEIEAKLMFDAKHPKMNVLRFLSAGAREFWLRMIVQTAFLDGTEGIIYGLYQVYSRLISYSKLWEMQIKHARSNS